MQSFIKILEILIWPVTLLIVYLCSRQQLLGLIGRVSRIKAGNFEAELNEAINSVKEDLKSDDIEIVAKTITDVSKDQNSKSGLSLTRPKDKSRMLKLATVSYRATVFEAWNYLEESAIETLNELEIAKGFGDASDQLIRHLIDVGRFRPSMLDTYNKIRKIRYKVIHDINFDYNSKSSLALIENYIEIIFTFVRRFEIHAILIKQKVSVNSDTK